MSRQNNIYVFFEEKYPDVVEFEVEAVDYYDAFDLAYENYGPQVEDLLCKLKVD